MHEVSVEGVRVAGPNDSGMLAHVDLRIGGAVRIKGVLLIDTGTGPRLAPPRCASARVIFDREAMAHAVEASLAMLRALEAAQAAR